VGDAVWLDLINERFGVDPLVTVARSTEEVSGDPVLPSLHGRTWSRLYPHRGRAVAGSRSRCCNGSRRGRRGRYCRRSLIG